MKTPTLKVSRLEGLTDGIFAIAMTILILDLRVPVHVSPPSLEIFLEKDIIQKLFIYMGSFVILGTHWVAMSFQIGLLARLNRLYLWTNILFLMIICVIPFSSNLLGAYPNNAASITFYAINLMCVSLCQILTSETSHLFKLNKINMPSIRRSIMQRALLAPFFYIAALFLAYWNMQVAFVTLIAPTLMYIFPGKVDKNIEKYEKDDE